MDKQDEGNRDTLVEMARMFMRGKVLCAAVRLGIADALGDRNLSLQELAATTASSPQSLHRLMRALACIGIVQAHDRSTFSLTPFGTSLRHDAPKSATASILFWADLLSDLWTYLPECVRAGGSATAATEMARLGIRSRWSMEPDAQALFHKMFAEPGADKMAPFVAAYDFTSARVVADLGGAGGSLISAILAAYPQLRGILVDRKEAVNGAAARLDAAGQTNRCELVAGDLLQTVPPGADVYILKNVLHGYDDTEAMHILRNCRHAMGPKSRLLVIEAVIPDNITEFDARVEAMLMSDLNMLAVTGGRERAEQEWARIISTSRMELKKIYSVANSTLSIIETGWPTG